jgi:hypothetical protein
VRIRCLPTGATCFGLPSPPALLLPPPPEPNLPGGAGQADQPTTASASHAAGRFLQVWREVAAIHQALTRARVGAPLAGLAVAEPQRAAQSAASA